MARLSDHEGEIESAGHDELALNGTRFQQPMGLLHHLDG
jgi:hypothetical protein